MTSYTIPPEVSLCEIFKKTVFDCIGLNAILKEKIHIHASQCLVVVDVPL